MQIKLFYTTEGVMAVIYAVILTDVFLICGSVALATFFYRKRKRKIESSKRNKPDMEIFRGSPERLERSIKERLDTGVKIFSSNIWQDCGAEEGRVPGRSSSIQKPSFEEEKRKTDVFPDLAEQTAKPFEHGGLNMNNNSTSYFNI